MWKKSVQSNAVALGCSLRQDFLPTTSLYAFPPAPPFTPMQCWANPQVWPSPLLCMSMWKGTKWLQLASKTWVFALLGGWLKDFDTSWYSRFWSAVCCTWPVLGACPSSLGALFLPSSPTSFPCSPTTSEILIISAKLCRQVCCCCCSKS